MEGIFVPISVFAMVVLIVWIAHESKKHAIQQRAELRRHLLDKFSSGQDLSQFLATPQGQKFMKEIELNRGGSAKDRIMGTVITGIVLSLLGAGFLVLLRYEHDLIFPGVILLSLGIGFLVASVVSYLLSKKWGVFEESEIISTK